MQRYANGVMGHDAKLHWRRSEKKKTRGCPRKKQGKLSRTTTELKATTTSTTSNVRHCEYNVEISETGCQLASRLPEKRGAQCPPLILKWTLLHN
jgi:hypothetical protein